MTAICRKARCRPRARRARRHPPPSSRARAASPTASMRASTADPFRRRPGQGGENRADGGGPRRAPDRLLTAYQIHSPDVVTVERPWEPQQRPRADAIVTRVPGLAIGVTTADCGPVLFADETAGVIGAAHAGWRGAATGVIEATIAAMERCGADRARIAAALGPMIGRPTTRSDRNSSPASRPMTTPTRAFPARRGPCAVRPPRLHRRSPDRRRHPAAWRTSGTAPMPTQRGSSATAGRPTAASRTTGVTSMP